MAHWAELDENNIVLRVVVGNNEEPDEGYGWLIENIGGRWIQTSYNGNIRKRFAGIGYTYNETLDAFVPPQCHPEANFDADTANWDCPNIDHEPPETPNDLAE